MSVNSLINNVKRGKDGKNIGISTGMDKLDNIIYGIQKKYLYTVGADSSGGKTSFALDIFVYNLIKNSGNTPISILYYSFEMSADVMFAKLLSRYLYDKYQEIITFEEILSLRTAITEEHFKLIQESIPWLKQVEKKVIIYDKSLNPSGIYATCKQWLKNFGEFQQVSEHKEMYLDKYPEMYKIVIIDHVALIGGQGSKKERIDTTVDYMIYFRNKCDITGVFIQQMNRNSKSMERKLNSYELYQLDDKENIIVFNYISYVLKLYTLTTFIYFY
jgi:replicative DNA helicase